MSNPPFFTDAANRVYMITAPVVANALSPISATAGRLPLAGPSTPGGSITPGPHHMSPQQYSAHQISQISHIINQQQYQQRQIQYQLLNPQFQQLQQHHQQQQQQQLQQQQQQQLLLHQQHQQHQRQQTQQQTQQPQQVQINKQKQESNQLPKQPQPIINNNQQQSTPKPTKHQATQSKTSINIKEKCINHYIDGQIIIESLRPLSEKKPKKKRKQKLEKEQDQQNDRLKERIEINKKEPERVDQPKEAQVEVQRPEPPRPPPVPPPAPIPEDRSDSVRNTRVMMATWSTLDVKKFIEGHKEISVYAPKFADEEIDGPALLQLIDKNSFQILTSMFKHGPAIKIEAVLSNYKLNE